jgi:hypothetical protein
MQEFFGRKTINIIVGIGQLVNIDEVFAYQNRAVKK